LAIASTLLLLPALRSATLEAEVTPLQTSPFLRGNQAFPSLAYAVDDPSEWKASGHSDGNRIGVRPASDPETGAPVTEFWFEARNLQKRWLNWQKRFPAELCREGMTGISLEIYPLTPVPSSLLVEFGLPLSIKDIGPAWRSSVGRLEPGRWNRIDIRQGSGRHPFPAGVRLVVDISKPGVPQREEVRFLVRGFKPLPETALSTNPPSTPVSTTAPIDSAYLQRNSPAEMVWSDPLALRLDLTVSRPLRARIHLKITPMGENPSGALSPSSVEVDLRPPVTRIDLVNRAGQEDTPFEGPALVDLAITDVAAPAASHPLLRAGQPFAIAFFNDTTFDQKLASAGDRAAALRRRADSLAAEGILVDEPRITLEVADLFISRYIPDDYRRQKERGIALTLLRQVTTLLDKADTELSDRATGLVRERPIPYRYDPARPLEIRNGRLYQGTAPVLLFGTQETSAFDAIPRLARLGFNSVKIETQGALLKPGDRLAGAIRAAASENLAAHLLFSTHYIEALPASGSASHVMLPYDILAPGTRPVLDQAYRDVLPPLRPHVNLVSIGTANEPGYAIHPGATAFEIAFRQWLVTRYSNRIADLNSRWRSNYSDWGDITLREVAAAITTRAPNLATPALSYDWACFRAYILGTHFRFMRDEVLRYLPDHMVWVKKYHTFGFGQFDPEVVFDQGSTLHNVSQTSPLALDYDRGIDPSAPLSCSEWKLVPGFTPATLDADPRACSLSLFENYARGLSWGIVWKWQRRDWRAMGDPHTFTRYPTAMEEIGRTSHRLQQLAPVFDRLATLGNGEVALLFDKASLLHQGQPYEKDFESRYWRLNRGSAGVRILHAGRATAADLAPRRLIAAGTANALDLPSLQALRNWVHDGGGTLWLTAPGSLALDPWGKPHADSPESRPVLDLITLASSTGVHPFGKGQVIVDAEWTGYTALLDGPLPQEAKSGIPIVKDVECRLVAADPANNRPGYFYILNRTGLPRSVKLATPAGDVWTLPGTAREIWNASSFVPAPSESEIHLPPWSVFLFEL
jgi:hypothetical protein